MRIVVTWLYLTGGKVDCSAIQAAGGSCFESIQFKAKLPQAVGQGSSGSITRTAAGRFRFAGVHDRLQKCPRGDDHGPATIDPASADSHTCDAEAGL